MSPSQSGYLSLFTAAFLYGSQSPASRVSNQLFPTFTQGFLRNFIATIVLTITTFKTWKPVAKSDYKWFIFRAIGNIISTSGIIYGVNHLSIGISSIIFYAGLIISGSLFGTIFFKDKLNLTKIISIILAVLGAIFIFKDQIQGTLNITIIIVFISGFGGSIWSVFSKFISHNYPLPQLTAIDNFLAGLLMITTVFLTKESFILANPLFPILATIYIGLTQTITGQLVAKGFKTVDSGIGSIILMNDLVFGIIFGYIIYHETLSMNAIFGGLLIFASSSLPSILHLKLKPVIK